METIADSFRSATSIAIIAMFFLFIALGYIITINTLTEDHIKVNDTFILTEADHEYTCQINKVEDKLLLLCLGDGK